MPVCHCETTPTGTVGWYEPVEALTEQSVFNEKMNETLVDEANAFIENEVQKLIAKIEMTDKEITALKDSIRD